MAKGITKSVRGKLNSTHVLLLALLVISLFYGYQKTIVRGPYSNHQWRQSDALSITQNYYQDGMRFFEPRMHLQESIDGKAAGEFPLIYYVNAAIWHITGPSHFEARLVNLLIFFLGLLALHKSIAMVTESRFMSVFIPLLIFTSPIIAFYANNFLVNVPALSLIFISWYFILKYKNTLRTKYLVLFSVVATLAVLLRVTIIIGLLPLFLLFLLEKIKLIPQKLFSGKFWLEALMLALPCLFVGLWVLFIRHYNAENQSYYFTTFIKPIWDLEAGKIFEIWHKLSENLLPTIFHVSILFFLLAALVFILLNLKKTNLHLLLFTGTILVALVLYMSAWYVSFTVHDYYLIETLLLVPPLLATLTVLIKKYFTQVYDSMSVKILLGLVLLFSTGYCSANQTMRYHGYNSLLKEVLISKKKIDYWRWYHWDYNLKFKAYESVTPYLRELGIDRNDKVISMPDQSTNISLYLMNQKGYTIADKENKTLNGQLEQFTAAGAKYLIVNDTTIYSRIDKDRYCYNKIGTYKNIEIFRLQE